MGKRYRGIFLILVLLCLPKVLIGKAILIDEFAGSASWSWWGQKGVEIKLVSPGCPESEEFAAFVKFNESRGMGAACKNIQPENWVGCDSISLWIKGDGSERNAYFYLYDNKGAYYHSISLKETGWHKITLYFKNFVNEKNPNDIGVNIKNLRNILCIYADKDSSFTFDHLQIHTSETIKGGKQLKYEDLSIKDIEVPIIRIPKVKESPVIDGKIEEVEWDEASEVSEFLNLFGERAVLQTKVFLAYDKSNIYFLFICDEPYIKYIKADEKERDGMVWEDDCIEIFLQPYCDEQYYHFITNAIGTKYDEIGMGGKSWDAEWDVKTSFTSSSWICEISIPFNSLGCDCPDESIVWRLNLCREEKVKSETSSWSWTKGGFHKPDRFGYLIFGGETTPTFSQLELGEKFSLGNNSLKFNIKNHNSSQKIVIRSAIEEKLKEEVLYQNTFTITPNKKETIQIKYPIKERGQHNIRIKVEEVNGQVIYQSPIYTFTIPQLISIFLDHSDGYYYSADKDMKLKVKLAPEKEEELNKMQLEFIIKNDKNEVIAEKKVGTLTSKETDFLFDIQPLSLGRYKIETLVLNKKGEEISTSSLNFQKINTPFIVIDEYGRIIIDGEPFFPLVAWYRPINYVKRPQDLSKEIAEKTLSEVKEAGFNAIEGTCVSYYKFHPEYYKTLLDVANEKGLKVLGEPWGGWEVAEPFKENKTIFAWYIADEPEFSGASREGIIKTHNIFKENDPYHRPTVMSNALVDGIKKYAGITDIHSTHPYPVPFQPLDVLYQQEKLVVELAKGKRISPWAIIQIHDLSKFGFSGGRIPTPEEVECLVYLAITAGAKGLMYYAYSECLWNKDVFLSVPNDYPEINEKLKEINAEIKELTPIILSKDAEKIVVVKPDDSPIRFILKEFDGKLYLITVNSLPKTITTTFHFPELKIKNVKDFFTGKSIIIETKMFTDVFQPYQRKVYMIE